jgi:hypothetical protein
MSAQSFLVFPWPLHIGPYAFSVVWAPRSEFVRPHWLSEIDYNHQVLRLRIGLNPAQLARQFWLRTVRAMHYSAGLDDGCPEEAFTHSYASGLMSFIRTNPEIWVWFNRLVETAFKPGARYGRYAAGERHAQPIAPPRRFAVGERVYRLESMPRALSNKLACWGDCDLDRRVMRLSDELYGTQLAVIFWHELTHAMHKEDGLDDGDSRVRFARNQADLSLRFMRQNPHAWRWFLCLTSHAANDPRRARQKLRKAA